MGGRERANWQLLPAASKRKLDVGAWSEQRHGWRRDSRRRARQLLPVASRFDIEVRRMLHLAKHAGRNEYLLLVQPAESDGQIRRQLFASLEKHGPAAVRIVGRKHVGYAV